MANDKVRVLATDGSYITLEQWQKKYGLSGNQIGKYFSLREQRFQDDLGLYGELIVCEPLMRLLDFIREDVGHALTINSFNRDEKKQEQLKEDGFRAATVSPHVYKVAADIDTITKEQTRAMARRAIELGKKNNIICRVGSEQYIAQGQTFVHVDVAPMYYGVGKPFEAKCPHPYFQRAYSIW